MKQSAAPSKNTNLASYLVAVIFVILPFHAFLTTWAGSNFGHFDLLRIIKELLMVPLGLYAAALLLKNKTLLANFKASWLTRLIVAYSLLFFWAALLTLWQGQVSQKAVIYSLIVNLRFLWFFGLVWVVASLDPWISKYWQKIVLIPAAIVVGFGLSQKFVLPNDFLRHFGYGPSTIDAVQTVDQKLGFQRLQSTLRGANPFGAYLVIVITTVTAYLRKGWYMKIFLAAAIVALFFTYSRSAWLGVIVAVGFLVWQSVDSKRLRRNIVVGAIIVGLLTVGSIWILRDNDTVQNAIFHSDESSVSAVSSNQQRFASLSSATKDVWSQPLGGGPGSAGPASFHNSINPPKIAENYFLQIGQEVGWLGVGLFIAINGLVAIALWRRSTPLARVLLASLVGITIINLLSHAWADDTMSLLWWGLAGVALASPAILKKS
ncbi:MAG: O-antigen ligase family protein [Candidatus Saccharimonadales bacterium]